MGLETNRYDMIGLRACASYDIGVSGRTSVGAGTESKMLVRTEDGGKTVSNTLVFTIVLLFDTHRCSTKTHVLEILKMA